MVFVIRLCIFNPKSEIRNPKCDDSCKVPQGGKSMESPSGVSSKPDSLILELYKGGIKLFGGF